MDIKLKGGINRNKFGWHGISFTKPMEWELGEVEGNAKRGYLRLDNHVLTRMELRWQKHTSKVPLEKIQNKHLANLRKKARKNKVNFRVTNERDYRNNAISGKYFIWETDPNLKGVNLIAQSRKSSTFFSACVLGKNEENIEQKADMIFASMRDHTGDDKIFWSVFDFGFTTPAELKLNSHRFLSGHLKLDFSRAEDSFIFQRLSIANILLKGKSLTQLAGEFYRKQFKNVDLEVSYPREGYSEEGIYTIGREHGRVRFLKKRFFKSLFWECRETNHIYGVTELTKRKEASCLDKLASGVKSS
jgi:hypothetical protein